MSQTKNTQTIDDSIDLKELFFSLIARWKLITLCMLISLACALLYLRITPNTYIVNALTQVEDKKGASAALLGDLSSVIEQKSPAQAEIEILQSRMILGKVINDLNLNFKISSKENTLLNRVLHQPHYHTEYGKDQIVFHDQNQKIIIQRFNVPHQYLNVNLALKIEGQNFTIIDPTNQQELFTGTLNQVNHSESATQSITIDANDTAVENAEIQAPQSEFNESLNTAWDISLHSSDNISGEYIVQRLSLPAAVSALASNYSVSEKGKLSGIIQLNYQGTDRQHIVTVLNHILTTYNIQNIERRSAETSQTLKVLDEQLPELKAQLDLAEQTFNEFRTQHNTVDIQKESELYLSQSIGLETKKLELEQKFAELSSKYTNEHPLMREITAQTQAIETKINELNSTLKSLPDLQRQYLQLYRDVEVNTQLYTNLLNSYQQLKVAKAGEIGTVRIIDQAVVPVHPIKPKKLIILALSIFAGGLIGILIALAKNLLRSGIRSSEEIENALALPVYATIPRSSIQESRVRILRKRKAIPILAETNSGDIAIESLRSIRTALHFSFMQAENPIVSITGPAPELGKSFISVNLATIFAQDNKKTLIIDADLRRGYLHKYFGTELKSSGLSQYLLGDLALDNVIHQSNIANLDYIPRGKAPTNPSELLGSTKFKEMLAELSKHYERIIIDTPPVLAVTDSIIIAQNSAINLVVARYAKTQIGELDLVVNRFEQANVKVNGFILNDIQRGAANGKYGYGYNYAYSYTNAKDD